ncbi:MAG: histidine phosphatase family protein [Chloroflexota bacterium]
MELYFIRHGQSVNNAGWGDPNYQENPDPPLTDIGREQAQHLANYLIRKQSINEHTGWNVQNRHGFGLTHIYTSLMERAAHTAAPTAQALGIPFTVWKDIHEGGGIFSREDKSNPVGLPGKPRAYFEQHFPTLSLPADLDGTGWWNRPFETDDERPPRAARVLAELLARHGDREGQPAERIALVSHGGFFMYLMCAILKLPWRQAAHDLKSWFLLSNCSISRFDFVDDEVVICYLNRTDHLPDHLITG